jgi:hypothetical protein
MLHSLKTTITYTPSLYRKYSLCFLFIVDIFIIFYSEWLWCWWNSVTELLCNDMRHISKLVQEHTRNLNLVNLDHIYWAEHTSKNWEVILNIFFSILVACHYVLILDLLLKKLWGRDEISQNMFTPYKPLCVPLSIFDYFFFIVFLCFYIL